MAKKSKSKSYRRSFRAKRHVRHAKRTSVTTLAGVVLGEYVSLTAGDTMSLQDSVKAGGMNLARQQIIGLTGYDIQTNGWDVANAARFWGPVIGFKVLDIVGKKLLGPIKLGRHFRVF